MQVDLSEIKALVERRINEAEARLRKELRNELSQNQGLGNGYLTIKSWNKNVDTVNSEIKHLLNMIDDIQDRLTALEE